MEAVFETDPVEGLRQFVSSTVGREISNFEDDLANGYILSQILLRAKANKGLVVGGGPRFVDSPDAGHVLENFIALEPLLHRIGVELPTSEVVKITSKTPGAGARVLLQVKGAFEAAEKKKSVGAWEGRDVRRDADARDEKRRAFFEATLRRKLTLSTTNEKMEARLRPFQEVGERQVREEAERVARERAEAEARRAQKREAILAQERNNKAFFAEWEKQNAVDHKSLLERAQEREKAQLRFELTVREQKRAREERDRLVARRELDEGLDAFERTLANLEDEAAAEQPSGGGGGGGGAAPAARGLPAIGTGSVVNGTQGGARGVDHVRRMQERLPSGEEMASQASAFMGTVKARAAEEKRNRAEREARRRKLMADQAKAHAAAEAKAGEDALMERLVKASEEERLAAAQLAAVRDRQDQIVRNRLVRERQYAERRDADYREVLARDAREAERVRQEYHAKVAAEEARLEQARAAHREAKQRKHEEFARFTVFQVLGLAERVIHHRETFRETPNVLVPAATLRDWKGLLLAGARLASDLPPSEEQRSEWKYQAELKRLQETTPDLAAAALDDRELGDYLASAGDWDPRAIAEVAGLALASHRSTTPSQASASVTASASASASAKAGKQDKKPASTSTLLSGITSQLATPLQTPRHRDRSIVADMVAELKRITAPPDPAPAEEPLPNFPVRACVVGSPFSGRTTVARALAQRFGLRLLSAEEAVAAAVAAGGPEAEALRKVLAKGKPLPDETVAKLVAAECRVVPQDPAARQGFVLDGYPATQAQAELLDRELSGFIHPSKRSKATRKPSRLAPGGVAADAGEADPPAVSGLDCVFVLQVPDAVAIRRQAGERLDPQTGELVHVDDPALEPEALLRLVPAPGHAQASASLALRLKAYPKDRDALARYYAECFPGLTREVPSAEEERGRAADDCDEVLRSLIRAKADEEARLAAERAANEVEERRARERAEKERAEKEALAKAAEEEERARLAEEEARALADPKNKGKKPGAGGAGATPQRKSPGAGAGAADAKAQQQLALQTAEEERARAVREAEAEKAAALAALRLDPELAEVLMRQWTALEESYCSGARASFRGLRELRKAALEHVGGQQRLLVGFLARPDGKQELVTAFHADFNSSVPAHMRSSVAAKEELHVRVSELCDRLWQICDDRRDAALVERARLLNDGWLQRQVHALAANMAGLAQCEVDRVVALRAIVRDYFEGLHGRVIAEAEQEWVSIVGEGGINLGALAGSDPRGDKNKKGKDGKPAGHDKDKDKAKAAAASASARKGGKGGDPADDKAALVAIADVPDPAELLEELDAALHAALAAVAGGDGDGAGGADPKKAGAKKAAAKPAAAAGSQAKKKGQPEVEALPEVPEIAEATAAEREVFAFRLELIRRRAHALAQSFADLSRTLVVKSAEWIQDHWRREMAAVKGLAKLAREAIEAGTTLPGNLSLRGAELAVVVASSGMTQRTIKDAGSADDVTASARGGSPLFSLRQVAATARQFRLAAPSFKISVQDLASLLSQLGGTSYGLECLPEDWLSLSRADFDALARRFDYDRSGYVDWRCLVLAMYSSAVAASGEGDEVVYPSLPRLIALRAAFEGADREGSGAVDFAVARSAAVGAPETIASLFPHPSNPAALMDYRTYLLFASADRSAMAGMRKAFAVRGRQGPLGLEADVEALKAIGSARSGKPNPAVWNNLASTWEALNFGLDEPIPFDILWAAQDGPLGGNGARSFERIEV